MNSAIQTFLLSLPALLSIVNPIGGVMMFSQMTAGLPIPERRYLARRVGLYSAIVLLVALWIGSHLLQFFGVSLSALRIAGGRLCWLAWPILRKGSMGRCDLLGKFSIGSSEWRDAVHRLLSVRSI